MHEKDFNVPFQIDKLGPNPKRIHLNADEDEREALCARFDLQSMEYFKGEAMLKRLSGKKIECHYQMQAKITQQCVVTFKPIVSEVNLDFQRIYDGSLKHKAEEKEIEIYIDDTEELDPIIDGVIDLGSAVSEELGLEIDPFPRADGTDYTDFGVGPEITEEEVQSSTPFAALAELKNKL